MNELFIDIGQAFLFQEPGEPWSVELCFGDTQLEMDGEFDTPGQALDGLMKWAKGRGFIIATGLMSIRKPTEEYLRLTQNLRESTDVD